MFFCSSWCDVGKQCYVEEKEMILCALQKKTKITQDFQQQLVRNTKLTMKIMAIIQVAIKVVLTKVDSFYCSYLT